jgi:hypothetical protein
VSLPTIALIALAYVALLVVIIAVLRAAGRADDRASREYEKLARPPAPRKVRRFASRKSADRKRDKLRRTG